MIKKLFIAHKIDLDSELQDRVAHDLQRQRAELERTQALLAALETRRDTSNMDVLRRHARGWLLVVLPTVDLRGPSGPAYELLPINDAWNRFDLALAPPSGEPAPQGTINNHTLQVNARTEQRGAHVGLVHRVDNEALDTLELRGTRRYAFGHEPGAVEVAIQGYDHFVIGLFRTEKQALDLSGIEMTLDDQQQTPYDYNTIRRRLEERGVLKPQPEL